MVKSAIVFMSFTYTPQFHSPQIYTHHEAAESR